MSLLAPGQVLGAGRCENIAREDIRHLIAGGAEMKDFEQELAKISGCEVTAPLCWGLKLAADPILSGNGC
ncbi:hypothetical protein [Yoonia sediminilitoris]|uniref:Uncharacterized protein n=1 Tax=Yoonia sediminilitoris TaxID=1286148 RepID=A0A2T6K9Q9_9RHOB|nr:hypothetical protein [Yoonia sediminilitoris]PUB11548.1 hypothetical protein C8N45_11366 [Yoonia sediminilitoris]RCW91748.1 hypothetical protein DFP92_11366 [Yoonia sediminilitoris]